MLDLNKERSKSPKTPTKNYAEIMSLKIQITSRIFSDKCQKDMQRCVGDSYETLCLIYHVRDQCNSTMTICGSNQLLSTRPIN